MQRIETGYVLRPQFRPLHTRRKRFFAMCCHRRAGKTVAVINDQIDAALRCDKPEPRFGYIAPFRSQAKATAWNYLKSYGLKVPGAKANESELRVDFRNGARVRLYGADNADALRGHYFDGVVFDEYGDTDPTVYPEIIRPALADRQGWAIFAGTSRGKNHFAELMDKAAADDVWDTMILRASESGIISAAELAALQADMSPEQYAAEFECSFEGSVIGAYWGREMQAAERDGRICGVPYEPSVRVDTAWDLGVSDATAIWFTQTVGREVRVIDFYANSGEGLPHYIGVLDKKGYLYGRHVAPHDIQVREFSSGAARIDTALKLGIKFEICPDLPLHDGIDRVRGFIGQCWFDRTRTADGRAGLSNYRKTWDDKRKVFSSAPYHDWSSHAADAFRYLAVSHKITTKKPPTAPARRFIEAGANQGWMGA